MYDSGANLDNYKFITTPSDKQMYGARSQECDLVEVQNLDIPVSCPKWPSSMTSPAGNQIAGDEICSIGSSAAEVPTSTIDSERIDTLMLGMI